MNDEISDEELDKMLAKEKAILDDARQAPSAKLSPKSLDRLMSALGEKFPKEKHILSVAEMKLLVLKAVSERPMDGFEIIKVLSKANFKIKDAGEGAFYGIFRDLEQSGFLESETIASRNRMVQVYRVTPKGHDNLETANSKSTTLAAWAEMISAAKA